MSSVAAKTKILGYNFAKKPKIFKFLFFLIFFKLKRYRGYQSWLTPISYNYSLF